MPLLDYFTYQPGRCIAFSEKSSRGWIGTDEKDNYRVNFTYEPLRDRDGALNITLHTYTENSYYISDVVVDGEDASFLLFGCYDDFYLYHVKGDASHAILVDLTTGEAVAQRLADERIYPASMTKIMTVLVAVEALTTAELETTFTMTADIVNAAIAEGASRAGFEAGERVKLIDLLYGAALPSGADATAALAQYVAGSEQKYVELMNEKAQQLGLTQTRFVNASGLHHDEHYSTVREIAALMAYAMDNELCRKLLSAASYTTASTEIHPYGITLYSTTFSRMSSTTFGPVSVIAGKTGYTDEARFCLVSLATRPDGREYVLVTVGGSSKYAPAADCSTVYGKYLF